MRFSDCFIRSVARQFARRGRGPGYSRNTDRRRDVGRRTILPGFGGRDLAFACERLGRRADVDGLAKKKGPKLATSEVMLANALVLMNQSGMGRMEYERWIKEHPLDPEAYLRIAELDYSEGRFTESGLLFDKASEVVAKFDGARNGKR